MDEDGTCFDSRTADSKYPQNADANGAYHIGLKGLMLLDKIDGWDFAAKNKVDLKITNQEWYKFVQERKCLHA